MGSKPPCAIPDCDRPVLARGMCVKHYNRWLTKGTTDDPILKMRGRTCSVEGCDAPVLGRSLCRLHYKRWYKYGTTDDQKPTNEQRFWAKVDKNGPIPAYKPELGACWLWLGAKHLTRGGYGTFKQGGRQRRAHRVAYEYSVGPIPDSYELDHLCHVTACVNPAHLEPVTGPEHLLRRTRLAANNAAKTHCPYGHPYDAENTIITANGSRACRACVNQRVRLYQQRRRAAKKSE